MSHPIHSIAILSMVCGVASATTWHVSPTGSGADGKTLATAFTTPAAGVAAAKAGDTVLLAGGTYKLSATLKLTASGTANARICLFAENAASKRAILDFTAQGLGSSNQGVYISGDYWHIKGLDITKAGDNGVLFQGGSNNILEFCNVHENMDAGVQLKGGAADNLILNCDSWWNYDPGSSLGGNADGFAPKMDVGSGNTFKGCRAWGNSDDGWDGYLRPSPAGATYSATTTIEDSWAFDNGYYHGDPKSSLNNSGMNGNGMKMGGGDKDAGGVSNGYGTQHNFTLRRCLSFNNKAKGFDQNNNRGSMTLINCTGINNGTSNFQIDGTVGSSLTPASGIAKGSVLTVKNSLSTGTGGVKLTAAIEANNSWSAGFSVSAADFVTSGLDTTGVRGPRKADGSLPDLAFMHLKSTSALVNAGVALAGITYNGKAPDLGAFETGVTESVWERQVVSYRSQLRLVGGVAGQLGVAANLQTTSHMDLTVSDIQGHLVVSRDLGLWLAGERFATFDLSGLGSGVYLARLQGEHGLSQSATFVVR